MELKRQLAEKDILLKQAQQELSLKDAECSQKIQEAVQDLRMQMSVELYISDAARKKSQRVNEVDSIKEQLSKELSLRDAECLKKIRAAKKQAVEAKRKMALKDQELKQIQTYLTSDEDLHTVQRGSRVVVVGLSSEYGIALNGSKGTISSDFDIETGRFSVQLDEIGEKSLKLENLVPESDAGHANKLLLRIRAKIGGTMEKLKMRQLNAELEKYRNQRSRDLRRKDDEISALKEKCSSLESQIQKLKRQPLAQMKNDAIIDGCVQLMIKELPQDDYDSALRRLMRCLHPDRNPAKMVATKMMQSLTPAMPCGAEREHTF